METMPNWLAKRAGLTPNRIAIVENEKEHTFYELYQDVRSMAEKLSSIGIKKGDHVALLIGNHYTSVVMIHALQSIGAVMVLLNTRLTPNELSWQINDSDTVTFLYDEKWKSTAKEVMKQSSDVDSYSIDQLHALSGQSGGILQEFRLSDAHTIIYTSGTTGNPKGVILTNGNHWWSAVGSVLNLGLDINDRWLSSLPLFHVSGLSILMRSVIYGITVVLHETFDAAAVNRAIEKEGVTIVSAVSVMLQRMMEELDERGNRTYPDTFRCLLLGGGPAPRPLLERCTDKGIPVFQTYGMTETASQIVTLAPEYMLSKLGSAGKSLFPSQLKIEKAGVTAAPGEIGEIVVKGPNVTAGYYRNADKTHETITEGWLYSGDLGYLDEDGFLFVVDRRSDLIISGGENIYPAELESILLGHPAVKEAGVTGQAHQKWGQVPVAFIVTDEKPTEGLKKNILTFCEGKLARYKIPADVHFINELPRNASNKLLRRKLLDMVQE